MPFCVDCIYFNAPGVGRQPKSCEELGEQAANPACPAFAARGAPVSPPTAPYSHADGFRDILSEQLACEDAAARVVAEIKQGFQREGHDTQFDEKTFLQYISRLSDLRLLFMLVGHFECDVYRDTIMAAEIERLFGLKISNDQVKQIELSARMLAKEINVAPRGVPQNGTGTQLGSDAGSHPKASRGRDVPAVDPAARTAKPGTA